MKMVNETPSSFQSEIAIRSLHSKHIFPRVEIGVSSQALLATHLVPVDSKCSSLYR